MTNRESPLYWSLPLGTWFLTRVRLSVFFPVVVVVLCIHFDDVKLGATVSGLLFLSVLCHEFGHVLAARLTGGVGDEILIWPLGGLASVHPAGTFQSKFMTAAAGPIVNLAICLITLPAIWEAGMMGAAFDPLTLPPVSLSERTASALLILTFTVNWVLLLVNLIPVFPLDGGRMLQVSLSHFWGSEAGTDLYIKIGFVFGFLMMFAGLLMENVWIVFLGGVVLVLNMQETMRLQNAEAYDEFFMGYDFSQGYTSLERSVDDSPRRRPGPLQRWREKRKAEKQRRQLEKEAEEEQRLDALLEKVHTQGMDALTEAEKRQLNRASARYRDKGNSSK